MYLAYVALVVEASGVVFAEEPWGRRPRSPAKVKAERS